MAPDFILKSRGYVGLVFFQEFPCQGEYCNISQQVVIGLGGKGDFRGIPEIGDRVYIGPGAKIFGKISIGNNVAIGANAVVSKSIPDNAVVVGNPGRIVGYEGSGSLIELQDESLFLPK